MILVSRRQERFSMNIPQADKMVLIPQNKREDICFCLRSIADSIETADLYDAENLIFDMDSGCRVFLTDDDCLLRDLNGTHRFTFDVSWYEKDRETHQWDNVSLRDRKSLEDELKASAILDEGIYAEWIESKEDGSIS